MEAAYGLPVKLHCDGAGALTELWMCVDKGLNVVDCKEFEKRQGAGVRIVGEPACESVLIPPLANVKAAPKAVVEGSDARPLAAAMSRLAAWAGSCDAACVAGAAAAVVAAAAGAWLALRCWRARRAAQRAVPLQSPLLLPKEIQGAIAC